VNDGSEPTAVDSADQSGKRHGDGGHPALQAVSVGVLCGWLFGREMPSATNLHQVFFADIQHGYAVGTTSYETEAVIIKTVDGRATGRARIEAKRCFTAFISAAPLKAGR
jgi:hypothetical protein